MWLDIFSWKRKPRPIRTHRKPARRHTFRPLCEALEDRLAPATFMVLNTDDSGAGSLRQAILDANDSPNGDTPDLIAFDVPGPGVHTINVGAEGLGRLPTITDPLTIDGYTQPGASPNTLPVGGNAVLRVELNGSGAGPSAGLTIFAGSTTVRGLVINRFELAGISIRGFTDNVIEGNFIGTDASGTIGLANQNGISISLSSSAIIGGTTPEARNVISGNRSDGVFIDNSVRGPANSIRVRNGLHQVEGNYIGTDSTGGSPLGNSGHGIHLISTANTIGSQVPGAGNTIAFNGVAGIHVRIGRLNSVLSNSIHSNADLGISFSGAVAPASPVLTEATSSAGTTTIAGALTGQVNATFIVEFFSNSVADPSGFGEGETFLGSALVTTDDTGSAAFQINLPVSVSTGRVMTATATAPNGTTSRFSEGLLLTNQPPVNTVPGDQVAAEDVAKAIGGLSVFDDDTAGILTVTFTVDHGTLTVNVGVAGGLAPGDISGNGTAALTLTGTQARINATLAAAEGLTYLGLKDFSGQDTLWMTTMDVGGLSDTDALTIDVLSAQEQADRLVAAIADLEDDDVLNGGQANALVKMVRLLLRPSGEHTLRAFANYVSAMVSAGILTREEGDTLTRAAESIVASTE